MSSHRFHPILLHSECIAKQHKLEEVLLPPRFVYSKSSQTLQQIAEFVGQIDVRADDMVKKAA